MVEALSESGEAVVADTLARGRDGWSGWTVYGLGVGRGSRIPVGEEVDEELDCEDDCEKCVEVVQTLRPPASGVCGCDGGGEYGRFKQTEAGTLSGSRRQVPSRF
jgi:hypothetical protein